MTLRAALQPPQRSLQCVTGRGFVGRARGDVVERHGDVGAQSPLDLGGALGGEVALGAVDVAGEFDAVVVDAPERRQREHLETARVGEQRAVPRHKAVQAAQLRHDVFTRAHVQMVGVGEDNLRAHGLQVAG